MIGGVSVVNLPKWICPVSTSVRVERAYKDLAEVLEVELTTAANIGLEVLIEDRLSNISDPRVTPEMVAQFREVKTHHLKELEIALHRRTILDQKIKEMGDHKEKLIAEREAFLGSLITVVDEIDGVHKKVAPPGAVVPAGLNVEVFNPDWHRRVSRPVAEEESR